MKVFLCYIVLVMANLILILRSEAKINFEHAMGIWLFNEGSGKVAKDLSGNGNDGILAGGVKWARSGVKFAKDRPGERPGHALKFDGKTGRLVIGNSDSLYAPKAWTITSWVCIHGSENGYGHIVGKRSNDGTNYAFRTDSKGVGWDAYFNQAGWKGAWQKGKVSKGSWVYMTATYDGVNTIRIYQNTEEIGSADVGGPPPQDTSELHIGGWQGNTSELLDGQIDELAIFSIVLSKGDMTDLMKKGFAGILRDVGSHDKLTSSWGEIKSQ